MVGAIAQAIAIGLALGILTGIPLGVVNVAVVELAGRDRRGAAWLGIGGALADAIHVLLAIVGYGALITASQTATRVLAIASAAIVGGYAVWVVQRPRRRGVEGGVRVPASRLRAVATGLSLTLPNPGALIAWTAVAAAVFPGAPPAVAIATAAGVGVGSAMWFVTLARIAERAKLDQRTWAPRVVAAVMLGIAVIAVVRTIRP